MAKYEIDGSAHPRLRAFLMGKQVQNPGKVTTLDLSEREATTLLRKAKRHGFEDAVREAKAKRGTKKGEDDE